MSTSLTQVSRIALLCDFDGTISPVNVQEQLYYHFADPTTRIINERWDRGEISTKEELEACFNSISASKEEMQTFFDTIHIDPHFPALIEYCQNKDIFLAILSDGLRWYIDYILNAHGILDIPVYANDIFFTDRGFQFGFPWFDNSSPLRGTSKNNIIRNFREQGYFIIFAGDGLSDTDAVQYADLIFAKDYLLSYVNSHHIPALQFENLLDVINRIKDLSLKADPDINESII
jgi:2-hydroxy-3-keto-5-methylthiopentenyl-1-phosphate phosphatase